MPKLSSKALSDAYLKTLKPGPSRLDHYDAIQRGLGIRIAPSGLKSWFVMRRINGRMTRVSIGRYPEIGLSAARLKAAEIVEHIAEGKAPITKTAPTLIEVIDDWFARDQSGKRSAEEKRRAMNRDVVPVLGRRRIDTINRSDIRDLLDGVVDRGAPIHANRLFAYLRRLFNWAVEREIIVTSPTASIKPPSTEQSRDRALSGSELANVWNATQKLDEPFGAFFRLLILTGQRRNEVAGARWSEIDLERGEWTIPASRAKNGKAHLVHLSQQARANLSGITRAVDCDLVFTTTGKTSISGFSKMKATLDGICGVTDWTIHDLRRTFATLATGDLGIEPVVIDKILNHSSGAVTGIAAVYQRHAYIEQRRSALKEWGTFIQDLVNEVEAPSA